MSTDKETSADHDWQEMGEQWRRNPPTPPAEHAQLLTAAQRSSRRVFFLALLVIGLSVAFVATLTTMAILHRGLLTYSFAIIGWSIYVPVFAYMFVYRDRLVGETLDARSMLNNQLLKQNAKRDLLMFITVLLGVETLIATAFWIVGRLTSHTSASLGGFAIFFLGGLLAGLAWRQGRKTGALIQVLRDLQGTLSEDIL